LCTASRRRPGARASRTIPLPFDPDPAKVEAKFDKGVLHIHLPKPAEVAQKQQKIEIKKG
jgi:HSP20 family protein